ncbi:MAG: host attachment protein [Rhodovulum sp.]
MELDRIWIVVITATRARILRNSRSGPDGDAGAAELVLRADHRNLRDTMDRPVHHGRLTRICGIAGAVRSDPVEADQRDFFRQVVQVLETHRLAGDFAGFAICAEPSLLERFRAEMPARLAARVVAERATIYGEVGVGALEWLFRSIPRQHRE